MHVIKITNVRPCQEIAESFGFLVLTNLRKNFTHTELSDKHRGIYYIFVIMQSHDPGIAYSFKHNKATVAYSGTLSSLLPVSN